jgi:hypothetical protein
VIIGSPGAHSIVAVKRTGMLAWRPVGPRGWPGRLLVTDKGAGSSEVEPRVEGGDDVAPDEVCRVLDRALGGLATEVDQNFNVS